MPGKRLFWFAIIIVELVFVYVLWKPVSAHLKSSRRAALDSPALRLPKKRQPQKPENPQPEIAKSAIASAPIPILPPKPSGAIAHSATPRRIESLVVNADLQAPEPVPVKPVPGTVPPSGLADSFWCHISKVETACDCQKDGEQTANLVMRDRSPEAVPTP